MGNFCTARLSFDLTWGKANADTGVDDAPTRYLIAFRGGPGDLA
jgi:hypothetical protein